MNIIKKIRIQNELTQEEFSKVIGAGRIMVNDMENDKCKPPLKHLKSISEKFNIDFLTLLAEFDMAENYGKISFIKKIRLDNGLTQEEFANIIGIRRTLLSKYENGNYTPQLKHLNTISERFNIDFDVLIAELDITDTFKDINIIKKIRLQNGLSQEAFAKKIGLSRCIYSEFELGKKTPHTKYLKAISENFNVDLDILLSHYRKEK